VMILHHAAAMAPARRPRRLQLTIFISLLSCSSGWITIKHTKPDGTIHSAYAKKCQELAPGVNYCTEIGQANVNVVIDVRSTEVPEECKRKVQKDSQMLLMYTGDAGPSVNGPWQRFVAQEDFTVAEALKMKDGGMPTGFTMGIEGLCEGTKAIITFPAAVGFDDPQSKAVRPPNVATGSTLQYHVEIIKVLKLAEDGVPYRPCFFSLIDTDGSEDLDELELKHHFARIKKPVPPHVMNEDKDGNGRISFDEFTGPKIPTAIREAHDRQDKQEL